MSTPIPPSPRSLEDEREAMTLLLGGFEAAVIAFEKHRCYMEEYPTTNGDYHVNRNLCKAVEDARTLVMQASLTSQGETVARLQGAGMSKLQCGWYQQRVDLDDGGIMYEAHDASTAMELNGAWAKFEGVKAKAICLRFIEMMNTPPTPSQSIAQLESEVKRLREALLYVELALTNASSFVANSLDVISEAITLKGTENGK